MKKLQRVEKIDEIFAIIPKRKAAKEKLDKLVELITGHCEEERKKGNYKRSDKIRQLRKLEIKLEIRRKDHAGRSSKRLRIFSKA